MVNLLERTISSLDSRLLLLSPVSSLPAHFRNVDEDTDLHAKRLREIQRLRGGLYLNDGALGRDQLTDEGLHITPEDSRSWHLVMLDDRDRVTGCAWYLEHDEHVRLDDLRVRRCPLVRMNGWRDTLWVGVETEIARARRDGLRYVEVGGWAIADESRRSSEGLILALAGYSLARIRGGCLGITTATARHGSSSILRRLGGAPLEADGAPVPAYYDPRYRCRMEILRFDSRLPNPRYAGLIERIREKMADVPVMTPQRDAEETVVSVNRLTLGGRHTGSFLQNHDRRLKIS